jgi:hypothetical protein
LRNRNSNVSYATFIIKIYGSTLDSDEDSLALIGRIREVELSEEPENKEPGEPVKAEAIN